MANPKILLYDLEVTPLEGYAWDIYEQNIIKVTKESFILNAGYKWLDEDKIHKISLPDFKGYNRNKRNDKQLVKELHRLMSEADVVIAHNGDRFDNKWVNKRLIFHGLKPISPFKSIDTLKEARKHFKFQGNSLQRLAEFLGVEDKFQHQGFGMWEKCMAGDMEAWSEMDKYVIQDIDTLEKVYLKLSPWIKIPIYSNEEKCRGCNSKLNKRGFVTLASGMKYQEYRCKKCGKYARAKKGERVNNPFANM